MTNRDSNFYQFGGTLKAEVSSYVVRQSDEELFFQLKTGEYCYVLNSRQMGKSSLRVRTIERLRREGIRCASLDLTLIGKDLTSEGWYKSILQELVKECELSGTINSRTWWDERSDRSSIQRLNEFVEEVLLKEIEQNIVIFIDEIDISLSLPFLVDDFFAWIRACYNLRADKPDFTRLTFCLLGVATPYDFIRERTRTPFNIGHDIELLGFQLFEAQPLAQGLQGKTRDPQAVMKEVLRWTGGQPFLTQKICSLIASSWSFNPDSEDEDYEFKVSQFIKSRVILDWESQDNPEHLKTIRDRLFTNKSGVRHLLKLYQQIVERGSIPTDDSNEQAQLRLSGLVIKQNNTLKVYNRIYEQVFSRQWIDKQLAKLPPYIEKFEAWLNSRDKSALLSGQALKESLEWFQGKSLSEQELRFLNLSELEENQRQQETASRQAVLEAQTVLEGRFGDATEKVIDEVLYWTGNNLDLTQKFCQFLKDYSDFLPSGKEKDWVEQIVNENFIKNWETGIGESHLTRVCHEFLGRDKERALSNLQLYQQVLRGQVVIDNNPAQLALLKAELVVNQEGMLSVANPIYRAVFNLQWVEAQLKYLVQTQNNPSFPTKIASALILGLSSLFFFVYIINSLLNSDNNVSNHKTPPTPPSPSSDICIIDPNKSFIEEIKRIENSPLEECKLLVKDWNLIKAAKEDGANNLVIPDGINKLCQIDEKSVVFEKAIEVIKSWDETKTLKGNNYYWKPKIQNELNNKRKQNNNFKCPVAARLNL